MTDSHMRNMPVLKTRFRTGVMIWVVKNLILSAHPETQKVPISKERKNMIDSRQAVTLLAASLLEANLDLWRYQVKKDLFLTRLRALPLIFILGFLTSCLETNLCSQASADDVFL